MATNASIIKEYTWNDMHQWIKKGDTIYQYLKNNLINDAFPVLVQSDKELLLDSIVKVINLIYLKFGFLDNIKKDGNLLWVQLTQNNRLDLRALLAIMLPFIDDNATENTPVDSKKHQLKKLEDLYLTMDDKGKYVYTNSQYNRCIRHLENNKISIIKRPFIKEYFIDHLELLLFSIETVSNKLYVNWIDVLPIKMNDYMNTKLYADTLSKIVGTITTKDDGTPDTEREAPLNGVYLINDYIDPLGGITYQDFYDVISNQLYHQIKNYKWLIYDMIVNNKPVSYITLLEKKIYLGPILNGNLLWSQLKPNQVTTFTNQWRNFLASTDVIDNTLLHHFYFFFAKYHFNAQQLIKQGKLKLTRVNDDEENDEENVRITPEITRNAKIGLANVPIDEIYLFLRNQINAFRKSWYYYITKIKKQDYLAFDNTTEKYVTPKNIYNYCKSMIHIGQQEFVPIPKLWYSLKPEFVEMILIRLLDIKHGSNNWTRREGNWFNINKYIKRTYPDVTDEELPAVNYNIHRLIRTKLVDIVFESLIYHSLLSDFHPNKSISDNSISNLEPEKRAQMAKQYFSGKNKTDYETQSYHFLTGQPYGNLKPPYMDFLSSDQNRWTFMYAMNWVSQINFFHHYLNDRVMYVTGSTGVGKSTQVPKLLLYAQKMLDYNSNGKIICTQPRVPPTVDNANTISQELGVPISTKSEVYDGKPIFTSNYYVQYKHQEGQHMDRTADSFLRIVTDGTLLEEMKRSPFLTKSKSDPYAVDSEGKPIEWARTYTATNLYDIIIVDEAHEHNANMDMILTLARDSVYVNNSIKLVIVSATMEDDEPIYRRYYRTINDNRAYPLSAFIEYRYHDRANMDRRIHISPPGLTTRYRVTDHYLSKAESDLINDKNYVDAGIKRTIELANSTTEGDILLFMAGQKDIEEAIVAINANTPSNIIALGFYSKMSEEMKAFVGKIHVTLPTYTRYKEDVNLDEKDVTRRVPPGTYTRAIIIATNVAEASITIPSLRYVVDTGYAKVNIYDPLEGVEKMMTLPISQSSSQQRRGRVGRVAPGDVYYLYDKEKVINNKTAYKIADENIRDLVVGLLKSDPRDSFIIDGPENDINNIRILNNIIDKRDTGQYNPANLMYEILKNPRPYLAIIAQQYVYIPDPKDITKTDISQYYTYYGISDFDNEGYPTLSSIKTNFKRYLVANHDDYHYQQSISFLSRAYTGYDDFILADRGLTFYIINPDENVIVRDLYTGRMIGIKYNPAVSAAYYYYLLRVNNIPINESTDISKFDFAKINYNNFHLLKYDLAIDDAREQLLVVYVETKSIDAQIKYTDIKSPAQQKLISSYFNRIGRRYKDDKYTTIRTQLLINLDKIKSMAPLTILKNSNNIMWYAYAIPYDLQNDVLALIMMITTVPNLGQWIGTIKSKGDIERFFNTHLTAKGDIYFLWTLWNKIKVILEREHLLDLTKIDAETQIRFKSYKERYLKGEKIPYDQFLILDKMYKAGKLNVTDEFYYYVGESSVNFEEQMEGHGVVSYIDILAKDNRLNSELLREFLVKYFDAMSTLNKQLWQNQYEIENNLDPANLTGDLVDKNADLILWAKTKLSLPGIYGGPNYERTKWDRVLESYLRAFSTNLMKNEGYYYLRISTAVRMDPEFWSQRLNTEKTFLNNKMEYIVYHNEDTTADGIGVTYLTPVKLQWVMELNPIYFYYLLFDDNNILYKMKPDEDVNKSLSIINSSKDLFNKSALIAYLDQIDNPTISKIVREQMMINR